VADPEAGVPFRKGHGTENDFVLLPDPDGALELTEPRVRALCDRRRGLGADGVLRVVRGVALGDPVGARCAEAGAEWFMDYRNADGSLAEMCGNGMRVFARYLVEAGLVTGAESTGLLVGTRGGPRQAGFTPEGEVTVDMGPVRLGPRGAARVGGRTFEGIVVDVGNPHLACQVAAELDTLDLSRPPAHDATLFPNGLNVEFFTAPDAGEMRMRVHERGVGETRSCGTGTVAATAAALHGLGSDEGELMVHVPGGRVRVRLAGGEASLTGPAVVLAEGELRADWWRSVGH
jgi:diaminopimelate epimerase